MQFCNQPWRATADPAARLLSPLLFQVGKATRCEVGDLTPGVAYSVRLRLLDVHTGCSSQPSHATTFHTAPGAPLPPSITVLNAFEAVAKWEKGRADGYLLEVQREGSTAWKRAYEGAGTKTTLTNLRPSSKYSVRLSSATEAEHGAAVKEGGRASRTFSKPSAEVTFETKKGGKKR